MTKKRSKIDSKNINSAKKKKCLTNVVKVIKKMEGFLWFLRGKSVQFLQQDTMSIYTDDRYISIKNSSFLYWQDI